MMSLHVSTNRPTALLTLADLERASIDGKWPESDSIDVTARQDEVAALLGLIQQGHFDSDVHLLLTGPNLGHWPSDKSLVVLRGAGVLCIQPLFPIELVTSAPLETLRFVTFLRNAIANDVDVLWQSERLDLAIVPSLVHLPPPSVASNEAGSIRSWRTNFGLGLLFWRSGPGFIVVRDLRDPEDSAVFTLDDPVIVDMFHLLTEPHESSAIGASDRNHAGDQLVEQGLALKLGPYLVELPYRLKKWPIPCATIRG